MDNDYNIKVSDFGFATSLQGSNSDNRLYDCKGTLRYMAPEIFKGTGYLGRSVDIFALGVILFSMKTGRPPFMKMASLHDTLYYLIQSYQFESYWLMWDSFAQQSGFDLPQSFKDLFIALVCYYPCTRLSLNEILKTEWMRGPIASHLEVKMYMKALQKEMELCAQEHYGKQESANSHYVVNMKEEENFDVQNPQNEIPKNMVEEKSNVMHHDVEAELDLEDGSDFDIDDANNEFDDEESSGEFMGYQEPDASMKKPHSKKTTDQNEQGYDKYMNKNIEEVDTNICTVFPDKI